MIKKTITYTDYDGAERTDDFYFNLTKTDLDKRTSLIETHELTKCKNCGAPIKRYPCKCEYCGTVYGMFDEWDDVRLFADAEEYVRATSAGIMTVNEARRYFGLEDPADPKIGEICVRSYC